jgi:hypothetical protein
MSNSSWLLEQSCRHKFNKNKTADRWNRNPLFGGHRSFATSLPRLRTELFSGLGLSQRRMPMCVEETENLSRIIKRAEEFIELGLIKGTRSDPAPKGMRTARNRGKGKVFHWLCKHVTYDEKKCLFWPFSKSEGYPAAVGYQGKIYKPTRLMCLLANGAPPSEKHQASHTCCQGNKGCIHPRHLVWKTRSEARRHEARNGRKSYGRGGKITPAEAIEIRALHNKMPPSEIGKMYGLSAHRIYEILRGHSHITPMSLTPRNGRFYPRLKIADRTYSLGGFPSAERAAAAYEIARKRARQGEPVLLPRREEHSATDIGRLYTPPVILKFGDCEGERVIPVDANQEQSVFLLHNALNDLHPQVKQFIIAASVTGDLAEAANAANLSEEQVATVLPRLRLYLQQHLQ